jgi:hypothetical protein
MSRLFVFGCSFTNYEWPTWADLLSFEFDEYENWALPGIGNRAIAERLSECHARNNITKDDVVIVQWSSHIRHDWYKDHFNTEENAVDGWAVHHESEHYVSNKKHADALFSERAYILHTLNMIVLAQSLLKSTECTWRMTGLGDIRNLGYDTLFSKREYIGSSDIDILDTVKNSKDWPIWELFPEFRIYENTIWNNNMWIDPLFNTVRTNKDKIWVFEKDGYVDLHPTPTLHNIWLNQKLKPSLDIEYNYNTTRNNIVEKFEKLKISGKYSSSEFFDLVDKLTIRLRTEKLLALPDKKHITGF